jgi:hypothetical protein
MDKSDRTVTLIDLCGHEKYLKTTLFGLTGLMPDYCMLVVGSNMGVQMMTREHISIACALNIPMFVAVTKVCRIVVFLFFFAVCCAFSLWPFLCFRWTGWKTLKFASLRAFYLAFLCVL